MSDSYIPSDEPVEIPARDAVTLEKLFVSHLRFQDVGYIEIDDGQGGTISIPNMPTTVTMKPMTTNPTSKDHSITSFKLRGNLAEVSAYVPEVKTCFDNFTRDLMDAIPAWKAWVDAQSEQPVES